MGSHHPYRCKYHHASDVVGSCVAPGVVDAELTRYVLADVMEAGFDVSDVVEVELDN